MGCILEMALQGNIYRSWYMNISQYGDPIVVNRDTDIIINAVIIFFSPIKSSYRHSQFSVLHDFIDSAQFYN